MKNIKKFFEYIFESETKEDQNDKDIKQMKDSVKKKIELSNTPSKNDEVDKKVKSDGQLPPDDPNLPAKDRINRLAKHVYDAYFKSNFLKYQMKDKIAKMKKDEKLSEDDIAEFTEMQTEIMANELLRGDNIEIQMVSIASDNTKLAQYATEIANGAKANGTKDATDKMQQKVNKKLMEPKPQPEEESKEKDDDSEDKDDKKEKDEK